MVDIYKVEQRRAQEYAVTFARVTTVIKDRLKGKGLAQESGAINPGNLAGSPRFSMSVNYETGVTVFEIDRSEAFLEEEIEYHFKDGVVRKQGYGRVDAKGLGVEAYFGEYTQEERDGITGRDSEDSEGTPAVDVIFDPPLPVALGELLIVAKIIDALETNPKTAAALARGLPTFPSLV